MSGEQECSTSFTLLNYERKSSHPNGLEEDNTTTTTTAEQQSSTRTRHALPENISWRVAHSWELLTDDLEAVGVDFFLRMFDENPEFLHLFHFGRDVLSARNSQGKRVLPRALRAHALIVMRTLGDCVAGATSMEELVPKLRAIGKVHARVGVQQHHYDVLFRHLADAIAHALGEQFDGETRQAWELVFRSLVSVIQHPYDLFQMEPLEGWGLINAIACSYMTIYTPFRMAGFTARNDSIENIFNILSTAAVLCLLLDMCSSQLVQLLRVRKHFQDRSKHSWIRESLDQFIDPIRFRVAAFLRGLQMERWSSCWPRMDAIALLSFPLQYLSRSPRSNAGVHWMFALGLLRLLTVARVFNFLRCAEHNLMLRRRMKDSERSMLRIAKLTATMLFVIHVSACLWCIVARLELGPGQVDPIASDFFPDADILLAGSGIVNAYLHSIHWAWVNLAGIGDCDSSPKTSVECLATLFVHICGATLYTITTGNVVAILEGMTQSQNETGADLAELGEFMRKCSVPSNDQERILQGYMVHHMVAGNKNAIKEEEENNSAPLVPTAVSNLPPHLRQEVTHYARVEAIKRRDPAFSHCSRQFMFAIVGSLKEQKLLLPGDVYMTEADTIPQQVILVESGQLEVLSNGCCKRVLQRGDVVGKRWLLTAGNDDTNGTSISFSAKTSFRAHTECTLKSGLSDIKEVANLQERYEKDFVILKGDRERINAQRRSWERDMDRSLSDPKRFQKAINKVRCANMLASGIRKEE